MEKDSTELVSQRIESRGMQARSSMSPSMRLVAFRLVVEVDSLLQRLFGDSSLKKYLAFVLCLYICIGYRIQQLYKKHVMPAGSVNAVIH